MKPTKSENIPIPPGRRPYTRVFGDAVAVFHYTPSPEKGGLRKRSNSSGMCAPSPDPFPPDSYGRDECPQRCLLSIGSENDGSASDTEKARDVVSAARMEYMLWGLNARVEILERAVSQLRSKQLEVSEIS